MKIYKKYHDSGDNGRLYRIWKSMKSRCYCINCTGYENYGGRNIIVSEVWKNNFIAFYNWSICNGYAKHLTIDREDGATMKQQAQNKRKRTNTNTFTIKLPENLTVKDVLSLLNISEQGYYYRIRKGWSLEKILNTVPQKARNKKTKKTKKTL